MEVFRPSTLDEALDIKSEHLDTVPIAGGTDLMVELNFDMRRPETMMDLTRIAELSDHTTQNGSLRIGAGLTYTQLIQDLAAELPGLAIASRTIGSPQIRNRGTIGGNLGTASPAGDALPVLVAAGAEVEVASTAGKRSIPVGEFIVGPKKNVLAGDELITATIVPAATGPQQFSKIGTRNAMVIAVASFAVVLEPTGKSVGTGIGSAGPTPIRAIEAEDWLSGHLEEINAWESRQALSDSVTARWGELVAGAARPIDDVRGTARYRRHALAVMARRCLQWAWSEYAGGKS
jgi:CO/xanthine dehydrogenase FAD-binding subunit